MLTAIWSAAVIIIGLAMFETVNSLDNAVVNANVLKDIRDRRAKRFFVTWGMFLSVGVVRGVLPFIIYYIPNAHLGMYNAMIAFWRGDPKVTAAVKAEAPLLLMAGGIFLVLLFLHWFLAEEKDEEECAFPYEYIVQKFGGAWFYSAAAALVIGVLYITAYYVQPAAYATKLMLAATIGLGAFFLSDGFKEHAERKELELSSGDASAAAMSDWSKVIFLEVIDATFSTDGVVGAFAFTMVVPYILIGNGIGAYIVRYLTLSNVDKLNSFSFLKNGAIYSVGILGTTMILEGFGYEVPSWFSPLVTFCCVGFFTWLSVRSRKVVVVS